MSHRPLSLSPDLSQLVKEGYDIEIADGHLLVKDVPYLNSNKELKRGTIVDVLKLTADIADAPADHTIWFAGEHPCNGDGVPLPVNPTSRHHEKLPGIFVDFYFSRKPLEKDTNFYNKIIRYLAFISSYATPATARTYPVYETTQDDESVFRYIDTASSRAGISVITARLEIKKIAIIGLGGTGSYVLDFVAKTPACEIHLFDGDLFSQHNAFRCPGAPSVDDLKRRLTKADYYQKIYSEMRRNIHAHTYVTEENINVLQGADFVFICIDKPSAKRIIVEKLEEFSIPFVDVGMGIYEVDKTLGGTLRITTSTRAKREHVREKNRIGFEDMEADNEYATNIQIADLNAVNAALAVIKWKKLFGFYQDLKKEHFATYNIVDNRIVNEDQA